MPELPQISTIAIDRIGRFSVDLVYPGRTGRTRPSLPAPARWRFSITLDPDRSPSHQGLYDRLKGQQTYSLDLTKLNLWRIPATVAAAGQSLRTDALRLTVVTTGLLLDQYAMYDGKLYRIAAVGNGYVDMIPRPDTLPTMGSLTVPSSINVWMPDLSAPATRQGTFESALVVTLETT